MRYILVEWLINIQKIWELQNETLCLAVQLVDRFSEINRVTKDRYQLLGITCMLIACKIFEYENPTKLQCAHITNYSYTTFEVGEMEKCVCKSLNFDFYQPTLISWFYEYYNVSDKKKIYIPDTNFPFAFGV